MGLLNKQNNEAIEREVLQKMCTSELLGDLIYTISQKNNLNWIMNGKHGDSGWRNVIVEPSSIIIEKPGAYEKRDKSGCVMFSFEDAGFNSLDEHRNEKGKVDITLPRMCYLYAVALQNRMQAAFKDCEFGQVSIERDLNSLSDDNILFCIGLMTNIGKYAKFSYRVPVPKSSGLF